MYTSRTKRETRDTSRWPYSELQIRTREEVLKAAERKGNHPQGAADLKYKGNHDGGKTKC